MKCKERCHVSVKEVQHLEIVKSQKIVAPQWFYDLCKELPELKIYDSINDLYDELGEY